MKNYADITTTSWCYFACNNLWMSVLFYLVLCAYMYTQEHSDSSVLGCALLLNELLNLEIHYCLVISC